MTVPALSRMRSSVAGGSVTWGSGRGTRRGPRSWTPRWSPSTSSFHPDPASSDRRSRSTPGASARSAAPDRDRRREIRSGVGHGAGVAGAGSVTWYRVRPGGAPEHRDHLARRPREDDPGRRDAAPGRHLRRARAGRRAGHGLGRAGARARDHDPRQERLADPPAAKRRRGQDQHRRHPRARRLRRRGRARALDGRRGAPAGRRLRGAAPADALRAPQGAGAAAAADPRRQQGGPARRPARRGRRRRLRALPRPGRRRGADRVPDRLCLRPRGVGDARPRGARRGPLAALLDAVRADPGAERRPRGAAAGSGDEPRRLSLPRPARRLPRSPRNHPARRGDLLVSSRRQRRARSHRGALRDRGARARPRSRPPEPARSSSSRAFRR